MTDGRPRRRGPARPLPTEGGPPPRRLDAAIDAFLSSNRLHGTRFVADVTQRWSEIAGPEVASHCHPASMEGDLLVVDVDHPAWVTQLAFLEDRILKGIAKLVRGGQVRGLKVHVRGGFGVD